MSRAPIGCRDGISPRKTMLRGIVPAHPQFYAGRAGDSPFSFGTVFPPGTALSRPVLAWYHPDVPDEEPIPFDYSVLHVDDDLIVVDKPHFLPTTSNGRLVRETLQTRLRRDFGEDDIVPLHRLDRLTSGVVLCSRSPDTRAAYQRIFLEGTAEKWYRGIASAPLDIDDWVSLPMLKVPGQRQVCVDSAGVMTHTFVKASGVDVSMSPRTGHTHQLRVLLNHLGAPLLGDDTYPEDRGLDLYDFSEPLALQHHQISFTDPISGARRRFSSSRGVQE